jgi:hypothetical protein
VSAATSSTRTRGTVQPSEVTVRMYNVGFGDCFLITFIYAAALADGRKQRHMLVDLGSTERPAAGTTIIDVIDAVHNDTNGVVDVIAATHRHRDHISGFGNSDRKAMLKGWSPTLVIRPWTDDPKAAANATGPSREFLRTLNVTSAKFLAAVTAEKPKGTRGIRYDTYRFAAAQLPNLGAIQQLDRWAASTVGDDRAGRYVSAGDRLNLGQRQHHAVMPGVEMTILGPPTLDQVPRLAVATSNSDEFFVNVGAARLMAGPNVDPRHLSAAYGVLSGGDKFGEARWLLNKLSDESIRSVFGVVRTLDEALNNTSLIFVITVGDRTMLFSGDAQIENWSHTLAHSKRATASGRALRALLADIDLYKVGHHGSRNATPKLSLFSLWDDHGARTKPKQSLITLMSTKTGKHGEDNPVPKLALVDDLKRVSRHFSTEDSTAISAGFSAPVRGRGRFEPT